MYLFNVVTEMNVDPKPGNTRAQQRLYEDDGEEAREPEKEHGHIEGRRRRAQRSQRQQPFTNGLNQHHNVAARPRKLCALSPRHRHGCDDAYIHDRVGFQPCDYVGTQLDGEACLFENSRELAKARRYTAISFAQHRRRLAKGHIMHDISFAYATNGWKTRNHALQIKLLKLLHASRIVKQKQQRGNLTIGGKDRQDGMKLVEPYGYKDNIIPIGWSQLFNDGNLGCRDRK